MKIYDADPFDAGLVVKDGPLVLLRLTADAKTALSFGLNADCDEGRTVGANWQGVKLLGVFELADGFIHIEKQLGEVKGEALPGLSFPLPAKD